MTTQFHENEVKCRAKIQLPNVNPSRVTGEVESQRENGPNSATIHLSGNLTQEEIQESMDNLKQKLDVLKSMVESDHSPANKKTATFIDEHILSVVFGVALVAILSVTVYAFQALYVAVTKSRT